MGQTNKLTLETQADIDRLANTLDALMQTPRRQRTAIGVARKWLAICHREKQPKGIVKIKDNLLAIGYGMNPPSLAHNIAADATVFNYPTITARIKEGYIIVIGSNKDGTSVLDRLIRNLRKTGEYSLSPSDLPATYLSKLTRLTQLLTTRLNSPVFSEHVDGKIIFRATS